MPSSFSDEMRNSLDFDPRPGVPLIYRSPLEFRPTDKTLLDTWRRVQVADPTLRARMADIDDSVPLMPTMPPNINVGGLSLSLWERIALQTVAGILVGAFLTLLVL